MTGRPPHQDFISSLHQGNFKTVRELYSLHYADLYYFCGQLVNDEQDANDIVTDTFIKLLQGRDRFDNLSNIKAFLYITTRNACLNYLKHRKEDHLLRMLSTADAVEMDASPVPGDIRNEIIATVSAEIEQLPEITRTIFMRLYCNREYITDIATRLDMPPTMVLQHKTKALHLLRKAIVKENYPSNLLLIYYLGVLCPEQQLVSAM